MNPQNSRHRQWRASHIAIDLGLTETRSPLLRRMLTSCVVAALASLAACGGGGSASASSTSDANALVAATALDTDTATQLAATAAPISTDVPALVDASVSTVQALTVAAPAAASAAGESRSSAQSVETDTAAQAIAVPTSVSVPLSCGVAGKASLTISGAPLPQLLNGQLDAGELYELSFDNCQTVLGQPVFNGQLSLSVAAVSSLGHTLSWTARGLTGSVPLGQVRLDGTATREQADSTDSSGAQLRHSHLSATALALQSTYNGHTRSTTLDTLDLARDSRWVNGLPASATVSGQCQVTQQRATGTVRYALALQGQATVGSDGQATTGEWLLTLPGASVDLRLDGTQAVIDIDQGKNGSVDHTITLPLGRWRAAAN